MKPLVLKCPICGRNLHLKFDVQNRGLPRNKKSLFEKKFKGFNEYLVDRIWSRKRKIPNPHKGLVAFFKEKFKI